MDASALADWTRGFAVGTLPICENPDVALIQQAIAQYLPEKIKELPSGAGAQEILEQVLGIAVIVQFGREKIGWTTTANPAEAEALRQLYSSEPYSKTRHDLGVDGQWIFLVKLTLLDTYFEEDLIERSPAPLEIYEAFPEVFRLEERQECVVVKL